MVASFIGQGIRIGLTMASLVIAVGCASGPSTMQMIVPGAGGNPGLDKVSHSAGATVEVLTVSGRQVGLQVKPSASGVLGGTNASDQSAIELPFDSLAVVYYLAPDRSGGGRAHVATDFPRLAAPDSREAGLTCAQLETELARAKAVRWYARSQGVLGWTASQRFGHDAALTGLTLGVTVIAFAALAGGGGGVPGGTSQPDEPLEGWQFSPYDLRQSITDADHRIEGLLDLKRAKSCPGSATLGAAADLEVLAQLEANVADVTNTTLTTDVEKQRLVRRTLLFDQLGPNALPSMQPILDPGEHLLKIYGPAKLYDGDKISMNIGDPPPEVRGKSILVFTDQALLVVSLNDEGMTSGERVRIKYADIISIEKVDEYHVLCHDVITRRESRVDSLLVGRMTCPAAEEVRAFVMAHLAPNAPVASP
jgi:hypothetical protein